MIQRVQSIFMFLGIVAILLVLFFPIWHKTNPDTQEVAQLNVMSLSYQKSGTVVKNTTTAYLVGLVFGSVALGFYSIFSYKNRLKQLRLNLVNIVFIMLILGLFVYFSYQGELLLPKPEKGAYGFSFFMPAVTVLFYSLANRFIRRDEALVRSADRLR